MKSQTGHYEVSQEGHLILRKPMDSKKNKNEKWLHGMKSIPSYFGGSGKLWAIVTIPNPWRIFISMEGWKFFEHWKWWQLLMTCHLTNLELRLTNLQATPSRFKLININKPKLLLKYPIFSDMLCFQLFTNFFFTRASRSLWWHHFFPFYGFPFQVFAFALLRVSFEHSNFHNTQCWIVWSSVRRRLHATLYTQWSQWSQ